MIFENLSGQTFRNVAADAGEYSSSSHEGRGLATGDFDQDGRIDVAISHTNEKLSLLRNISSCDHRAISVRLVGRKSNRDAIGAVLTMPKSSQSVEANIQLQTHGGSYLSSHQSIRRFIISPTAAMESVDQVNDLEVQWPGGRKTQHNIDTKQSQKIVEPIADDSYVQ